MAIRTEHLTVGKVYFGFHRTEGTYLFVRYFGNDTWGVGSTSLKTEDKYTGEGWYTTLNSFNTGRIVPLCLILTFPETGSWTPRQALAANDFTHHRAYQAMKNWYAEYASTNHSWTPEELTNYFKNNGPEQWATKNEPVPTLMLWWYQGIINPPPMQVAGGIITENKEKKKFKIINVPVSSTSKTLFKTQ